jgi:uridine kinase
MSQSRIVIAVAGISGSGKSTAAKKIVEEFGAENCVVISSDNYYREQHGKSFEEREKTNYDIPQSFDFDALANDLSELRQGKTVHIPKYNFVTHAREKVKDAEGHDTEVEIRIPVAPKKIIIIDGILVLQPPQLQTKFDMRIFVEIPPEVAVLFRIDRDLKERGRSFEGAMKQYLETVLASQNEYVLRNIPTDKIMFVKNDTYTLVDTNSIILKMNHVFDAIRQAITSHATNVHALFTSSTAANTRTDTTPIPVHESAHFGF